MARPSRSVGPPLLDGSGVHGGVHGLGLIGRILVRESGTEPLIRVMAEAATEAECHAQVDSIVSVIRAKGHEIK